MLKLNTWETCSALPHKGLSLFDGMTIIADSITDPRLDRVMPLLEEEQILMCRIMLDRLRPGDLVLDVGTGSGVFAIWAALKRQCRVMAVDISRRAIGFARQNALANGVAVVMNPHELSDGGIWLCNQDIVEFVPRAVANSWNFDVVILNPPFNPTCPGLLPAIHAFGGRRGQQPFLKQIMLAPQVQKVGGYCLGYQMSYDEKKCQVGALRRIQQAYGRRCRIEYAHVLADRPQYPVGHFLRGQYASFLDGRVAPQRSVWAPTVRHQIERYLRTTGNRGQFFSLVYYEAKKEASICNTSVDEVRLEHKPSSTWDSRVALHRCIVDLSEVVTRRALSFR